MFEVTAVEDVDVSLIPPRPRLYGLVGAEIIDEVWQQRQSRQTAQALDGNSNAHQVGSTPAPAGGLPS